LPLLTALALLAMAAGFWAWLCAPAAPQAASISAPRLHAAAGQVDAAGPAATEHEIAAGAPSEPDSAPEVTTGAGPAGSPGDTPVAGDTPVTAGPRAPPPAS
jgi:hypothetical protein